MSPDGYNNHTNSQEVAPYEQHTSYYITLKSDALPPALLAAAEVM
jgi:hypothetical protein